MGSATTHKESDAPEFAITSVRVERDLWDAFKKVADANERTVSQQLRWVLSREVDDHKRAQQPVAHLSTRKAA